MARETDRPAVKQALNQFLEECPECGKGRDYWRFDLDTVENPPITEMEEYDLVRYRCECGCVFKKIEGK